ncbi:hypothetical protein [Dasania marina]|uniref:hypothetical protein n=1 Tax=Dasania marina TaxID=471499 RepID=UPI00037FC4C3|nr:hypothetical protein [Dasania marina]
MAIIYPGPHPQEIQSATAPFRTVAGVVPSVPFFEMLRNFDSGTSGTDIQNNYIGDAFTFVNSAGIAEYDQTHVQSGVNAVKLNSITSNINFGGNFDHPDVSTVGHRIWVDFYMYVPAGFDFTTNTGSLKFLRFRSKDLDGTQRGALDLQIKPLGSATQFRMMREWQEALGGPVPVGGWEYFGASDVIQTDVFQRYSCEIVLDHNLQADGGSSRVKFWIDGNLIVESYLWNTLLNPDASIFDFLLFTYWNGGAPANQSLWVDDMKIASGEVSSAPAWFGGSVV